MNILAQGRKFFLTAALLMAPSIAFSITDSSAVDLELTPFYVFVAKGSFHDSRHIFGPNGWLGDISHGGGIDARILISLSAGIQPFVGYHIVFLAEGAPTADVMRSLYGLTYDFLGGSEPTIHTNYRLSGFDFGLNYQPNWIALPIKPYVGFAVRTDKFIATTSFSGLIIDRYSGNLDHISGGSTFQTADNFGYTFHLGFSVSFDRISIAPEAGYTTSISKIISRDSKWSSDATQGVTGGYGQILVEGEQLRKNFFQFGIGIRYQLLR